MGKPRVAILGRPNVGKSTLFNRLLKQKIAIIHAQPGVTRNRKRATCYLEGRAVTLYDTGGVFASVEDGFSGKITRQVEAAIAESDFLILVIEAEGVTGADEELAALVRRMDRPVLVVANKCDRAGGSSDLSEAYTLGFEHVIGLSAEHGTNVTQFRSVLSGLLEEYGFFEGGEEDQRKAALSFAVIGRPNVGKSSLVNLILQKERTIVSPVAGTTRDSIEDEFEFQETRFTIIDTAGLRRKSKVRESIEFYSTLRCRESINKADITVLLLEPDTLITDQDKKICDIVMKKGRGLIFAINKWDLAAEKTDAYLGELKGTIRFQFPELSFVPILTMSALTGRGIKKLLNLILAVRENSLCRIETGAFNRFVERELTGYIPSKKGRRLKVFYAVQSEVAPPSFTFFVNNAKIASSQYRNYIKNNLRRHFNLKGVPVFIHFRDRKR